MPDQETSYFSKVLRDIQRLRRTIHQWPDLSGAEQATANRLQDFLIPFRPDQVHQNWGGQGLAVVFSGSEPGPCTVFTSELDAVPISDKGSADYCSQVAGSGHMCGHDGHMATLAGLGAILGQWPPVRGRVVLLFRPQEETGRGAPAVVKDPRMAKLKPDLVFGFHNMPGYPLGTLLYRPEQFAWAATDYVLELFGRASHGGQPDKGLSPAMALAQLIQLFENLSDWSGLDGNQNISQTGYAQLGEADHGTSPGYARLRATLRSQINNGLETLCSKMNQTVAKAAQEHDLKYKAWTENWIPATYNHDRALKFLLASAQEIDLPILELKKPQQWSDDFGVLTHYYQGVFFGIGSGEDCSHLHTSVFDYPEEILEPALRLYWSITKKLHWGESPIPL